MWNEYLSRVARGREHAEDLSKSEAEALFAAWLEGELPELFAGAFWVAYRIKGESLEELQGFHDAIRGRMTTLARPSRIRPVVFASYNGTRRRANLLPLLALVLTRCGVPVLLHGPDLDALPASPSQDHSPHGRVHSIQILQHLGLAYAETIAQADTLLHLQGLTYLPLSCWQPGLARIFALREKLGIRSSVHTLLKVLHPFAPQDAVVCAAVTHPPISSACKSFSSTTKCRPCAFARRRENLLPTRSGAPISSPASKNKRRSSSLRTRGHHPTC
ncbi:DNA-binding protein YbiB [Acidithiobacillus sp. AMEEHan]|uniref:DNA-binding protein YbiB n=1 Tax=Acidithiobacillus sp. AMEEHan TaxID=2994951 RepID=UPI0027E51A96|nr:DNA-binding protein YbiB [Acidithiobacillus sp. AMEEHan]